MNRTSRFLSLFRTRPVDHALGNVSLGSATVALSASGTVQASVLYAPYGTTWYASGAMPTDYGFTGQHSATIVGQEIHSMRVGNKEAMPLHTSRWMSKTAYRDTTTGYESLCHEPSTVY